MDYQKEMDVATGISPEASTNSLTGREPTMGGMGFGSLDLCLSTPCDMDYKKVIVTSVVQLARAAGMSSGVSTSRVTTEEWLTGSRGLKA